MEQEKNNKGVIAFLVVLVIALAALCALLATGTISFKAGDKCRVDETVPNGGAVDNNTSSNNEENGVSDNNQNTSSNVNKELYSFEVNDDLHSEFKIQQIGNIFVAFSRQKWKQCFPDNVVVYNSNGEILNKFEYAKVTIDTNSIKLHTSDNGQCMGPDWESHVSDYIIDGSQLVKQ